MALFILWVTSPFPLLLYEVINVFVIIGVNVLFTFLWLDKGIIIGLFFLGIVLMIFGGSICVLVGSTIGGLIFE